MSDLVRITSLGGAAPVQAEGTVDGKPFYFRARRDTWSFAISEDLKVDPVSIDSPESGALHGYYAEGDCDRAGWMREDEARSIIERCAALYLGARDR